MNNVARKRSALFNFIFELLQILEMIYIVSFSFDKLVNNLLPYGVTVRIC